jgi:hypothetical protein
VPRLDPGVCLVAPDHLLQAQPAHTLDKAALDLQQQEQQGAGAASESAELSQRR